jgi:hypothetical protein
MTTTRTRGWDARAAPGCAAVAHAAAAATANTAAPHRKLRQFESFIALTLPYLAE